MFTLIAMGTGVAWLYSVVATLAPGALSAGASAAWHGAVAVYFEAAAVITVLVLLGQVLELRAREQTGGAIRALLDLAPEDRAPRSAPTAARRRCALEAVVVGDRLRVRPGETVPVDGVVIEGAGASTSRWSRANRCRSTKAAGRPRHRRDVNRTGGFVMRAEKVGRDTLLARIVAAGRARRSAAARRSSASPTRSPAGSCRR